MMPPSPILQPPQISAHYLHWLADYVSQLGLTPEQVVGRLDPCEVTPLLPGRVLPQALDRAAALLGDPDLGLHWGLTVSPRRFGVLGYLLHHCDTLGHAGTRLRYYRTLLFHLHRVQFRPSGSELHIAWQAMDALPHYHQEVFSIVSIVQFSRALTGQQVSPNAIGLMSAAPADYHELADYLACPVAFGQEATWMRGDLAVLDLPTVQPDAVLRGFLEQQAEAMLATLPAGDAFLQSVQQCVVGLMQEGEPTLARVAAQLTLSPRTLHRRLRERDTRFSQILDATRQHLAESYLRDVQLNIADVALLLGYAEQSPFTHAFRRWTGKTPSAWRRDHA